MDGKEEGQKTNETQIEKDVDGASDPEEAYDGDDKDEEAKQIATVGERISDKDFPIVPVEMQKHMTEDDARDLVAWINKDEYVKIKSYLDEAYAKYRSTAILDNGTSEAQLHARWAYEFYYFHLEQYKLLHDKRTDAVEAIFILLDAPDKLDVHEMKLSLIHI